MNMLKKVKIIEQLSKRQKECLTFIAWYSQNNHMYPTQKEIAIALNLKSNSAWSYTEALKKKKYLRVAQNTGRRNLRLTKIAYEALTVHDLLPWESKNTKKL